MLLPGPKIPGPSRFQKMLPELAYRQLRFPFLDSEEAAEGYVDELLDGSGNVLHLDRPGSVSGLIEIETDCAYDTNALGPFQSSSKEFSHGQS